MPSGKELRKWARSRFTPEMAARGFAPIQGTRFAYSREINGIRQCIAAQQSRWSPNVWIHVYMKGDDKTPGYVIGGRLGQNDVEIGGQTWSMANEAEAQESFVSILSLIDRCALPYFEKIKSLSEYRKAEQYVRLRGVAGTGSILDTALGS